jgi:phasin
MAGRPASPLGEQGAAMATNNFEIPTEMRNLADKSVEQAKTAFDSFMTAAQRTVSTWEGQVSNVQGKAKDVTGKALGFAEENVAASFDYAQKLVRARDVEEVMRLHAEYLQNQMQLLQRQANELGGTATRSATARTQG